MDTAARTWKCPRCATVASAGQRFCRQCGHEHEFPTGQPAEQPSTETNSPATHPIRPVSRALIAAIVVVFLVLGGMLALIINDLRGDPSGQPEPGSVAVTGTLPITRSD